MTALLVRDLPLTLGGAFGSAALRCGSWGFERFMRAPFTYLGLFSLAGLSAASWANAVYWQPMPHPAPMWGAPSVPRADVGHGAHPVVLAPVVQDQPRRIARPQPADGVPAVDATETASAPGGNPDVFEVQKKLQALKLFDGKADGFYGPRTARAIRAFEEARGLKPTGAVTPDLVDAVRRAPLDLKSESRPVAPQIGANQLAVADLGPTAPMPPLVAGTRPAAAANIQPAATAVLPKDGAEAMLKVNGSGLAQPLPPLASLKDGAQPGLSLQSDTPEPGGLDRALVVRIQKGLASLGFLAGSIDGVASDRTAKAIRNFEVFNNFPVTGQITPDLPDMLAGAGAVF